MFSNLLIFHSKRSIIIAIIHSRGGKQGKNIETNFWLNLLSTVTFDGLLILYKIDIGTQCNSTENLTEIQSTAWSPPVN